MHDPLPPLGALRAFALVAETGSLTAAAARLNVTQPAVSRRLRELEAALGVALVRRGANALRLTEEGTRYAAALDEAFGRIRNATEALGARPAPIRLRAYTTWALRWLIPRLSRFRAARPDVEVEVVTSTAPVDFARESLDAAVCSGRSAPMPGAVRLQPVRVAPFAAPGLVPRRARRQAAPAEAFWGITLLGSRVRPGDWNCWWAARGLSCPVTPLLFESTSLAIQAAIEGLGAVICLPHFVAPELRRRTLQRLHPEDADTGEHYWLLLPPGTPRPQALAFRDWLLEAAAEEES
jgi:LysR family glycine cleavage system transcriptional activator